MKTIVLFLSLIVFSIISKGNDGGYYAKGNTLFPLKNTNIELRKEVLALTFVDKTLRVNINFTFYNPDEEQTIIVGFVTPPADGVDMEEIKKHPQINNFNVFVNSELYSYNVTIMDSTDFILSNDRKIKGNDFIYYFPVTFKNGLNTIQHSYNYKGSFNVFPISDFDYKLTTGKLWGNNQIDDFELIVNLNENSYFTLPFRLSANDTVENWEIIGIGKLLKLDNNHSVSGYMKSGILRYHAKNFAPSFDFNISIIDKVFEFYYNHGIIFSDKKLEDCSLEELRILKNVLFAFKGYKFNSPDLFEYFSQYAWYIPNPLIKNDLTVLNEFEQNRFHEINSIIERKSK